jgi:predicted outer membrane repeat protein
VSVCWANEDDINFIDNTCGSRGGALAMIIIGTIFSAYVNLTRLKINLLKVVPILVLYLLEYPTCSKNTRLDKSQERKAINCRTIVIVLVPAGVTCFNSVLLSQLYKYIVLWFPKASYFKNSTSPTMSPIRTAPPTIGPIITALFVLLGVLSAFDTS